MMSKGGSNCAVCTTGAEQSQFRLLNHSEIHAHTFILLQVAVVANLSLEVFPDTSTTFALRIPLANH